MRAITVLGRGQLIVVAFGTVIFTFVLPLAPRPHLLHDRAYLADLIGFTMARLQS
jgi:hypothetical protein